MKIYLAARYSRREEMLANARILNAIGHWVTSRWINGEHEMHDDRPAPELARQFAEDDIADLEAADLVVAFTEEPGAKKGRARGGRHVELGYALGMGKQVVVVGHRENVFCHLPQVIHFEDFKRLVEWLSIFPEMARVVTR